MQLYKGLVKEASKKCQKNPKKVLTKRERDGIIAKLSRETAALRKNSLKKISKNLLTNERE